MTVAEFAFDVHFFSDGGVLHHVFIDEDRGLDPHRQRNGIAGPRVDFDLPVAQVHQDARIEDVLAQVADEDLSHAPAQFTNCGLEQIVRQGAFARLFLQLKRDSISLAGANPNR